MAYVGNPIDTTNTFQSLVGKRFSGDGSETDFTLDVAPGSVLDIEVFVGNVRQDPNSAYTVSGTTLSFTGAPPSGTNNIYVVHQAKSVGTIDVPALGVSTASIQADAITEAKIADDAVESEHLNNNIISGQTELAAEPADTDEFLVSDAGTLKRIDYSHIKGGGITQAQQWRITASFNASNSSGTTLSSNWEASDSVAYGSLGSAMSESSGVFTFPSTGYYLVIFDIVSNGANSAAQYQYAKIQATTNNSSYSSVAIAGHSVDPVNYAASCTAHAIIDVTDTSNVKVQFQIQSQSSGSDTTITGSTSVHYTGATFIRLGDT